MFKKDILIEFLQEYDENLKNQKKEEFTRKELKEVCEEFGVDSIEEVNALLESVYRRNIMLEATQGFDPEDPNQEAPSLDDLTEPEEEDDEEVPNKENNEEETEPSLDDLTEPTEEEEPTEKPEEEPVEAPKVEPVEQPIPKTPPPQAPTIPPSDNLPPEEKKEEPKVSIDWKKEKHLRTLYNNFFKVFPKKGTSTKLDIKFESVKANALHPDSKYLQASITSTCESEKTPGKYYNQWIQLRRQRNTQEWTVDLPCEVRCNCKAFIYYTSYANIRNKSLAGAVTRKGKLDGYPINYQLPSDVNNPNYIPALCKHLAGLTNEVFNVSGDGKVRKDLIV